MQFQITRSAAADVNSADKMQKLQNFRYRVHNFSLIQVNGSTTLPNVNRLINYLSSFRYTYIEKKYAFDLIYKICRISSHLFRMYVTSSFYVLRTSMLFLFLPVPFCQSFPCLLSRPLAFPTLPQILTLTVSCSYLLSLFPLSFASKITNFTSGVSPGSLVHYSLTLPTIFPIPPINISFIIAFFCNLSFY